MKSKSLLMLLGIVSLLIVGGYTGYLFYEQNNVQEDVKVANNSLTEMQAKMTQYSVNSLEQAISAKKTVTGLTKDSVKWSRVIKDIRKTIPKGKDGDTMVEILSYSGSGGMDLSMSVKTMGGSQDPFEDVAKIIQAFDESKLFKDTFVPSISIGVDQKGNEVLSFMLNTQYVAEPSAGLKADLGSALMDITEAVAADTTADSEALNAPAKEQVKR